MGVAWVTLKNHLEIIHYLFGDHLGIVSDKIMIAFRDHLDIIRGSSDDRVGFKFEEI